MNGIFLRTKIEIILALFKIYFALKKNFTCEHYDNRRKWDLSVFVVVAKAIVGSLLESFEWCYD
jgi:hypothetical protein